MVMYSIKEENSLEVLRECFTLCQDHFYEIGESHQVKPFDVDWTTLTTLLEAGIMSVLIARKGGVIVGYYMNIITRDLLSSTITAKELAIYVVPEHRRGKLFLCLVKETEQLLKSKGVSEQHITFIHGHNDKLPLKLGFTPLEITYKKHLGED